MKILSITTSSNICSVSILENETLIKEISINNGHTHSEKLMPIINEIFTETELCLKDINLLVCDIGPGSFTGIRIGIATIKAFSDSIGIPCIGVSSLEALSYNIKQEGLICSLIDAKHSNVYFGLFRLENGKYFLVDNLTASHIDDVINSLQQYSNEKITFIGDGSIVHKDTIENKFEHCSFNTDNINSYCVGICGYNKITDNETKSINNYSEELSPLYLKRPQAERKA